MKKFYKPLLTAASVVLLGFAATAQPVNLYSFTQSQGSYVAVTGGTVFNNTTWDDGNITGPNNTNVGNPATGPGLPIGFNFQFGLYTYNMFGINNNGWIFLGTTAAGVNNDANSSYYTNHLTYTGSNAPVPLQAHIGALCADLYGTSAAGVSPAVSEIRVETIGTAPSRTTVVQWTNICRLAVPVSFQIRMCETTNIVEIIYGSFTNIPSSQANLGLRGSAVTTDFNMRTIPTNGSWAASLPATTINDLVNYSPSLLPSVGQIYRWAPPPPCTGTPGPNTVLTPTYAICPNATAGLSLLTPYNNTGITYSWTASTTSALGPFTMTVPNGTNVTTTSQPLTGPTWFQLTVACTGQGVPLTLTSNQVTVSPVTISQVPYYEDFEGIALVNQLPNCSWVMPNLATSNTNIQPLTQNRVARSGLKSASFYYFPAGTNYIYTNGLQLYAGVTYSASIWFTTEYYGYNTWDLSIQVGPNQTPTGMVTVANLPIAASPNYKQLANVFTVPTSGLYYVAIKAISNGVCCGNYLTWDDLSITIPCSPTTPANVNSPTVTINANSSAICAGQAVNLTATGANTYTWNTGVTTSTLSDSPLFNTQYSAIGTNTLTKCTSVITKNIVVNPVPTVIAFANQPAVCEGSSTNIMTLGSATSFTWNTGANTPVLTVTPTQNTTYTVIGSFPGTNCSSSATQMITVNPLPTVNAINSPAISCTGAAANLSATGSASSYVWTASTAYLQGNNVTVYPTGTTNYTVTGTDANGCSKTAFVTQNVQACTGINEQASSINGLSVYPNPNNGEFTIELNNGLNKTIEIMDVTGRVLSSQVSANDKMNLNINNFANGVYYVKVKSDSAVEILKVVKQ